MKKIKFVCLLAFFGFTNFAYSGADCASILNPQLMYECVANEREKNLSKSSQIEFKTAQHIKDWKMVLEMGGGEAGKMTFYYSPRSASFKEINDPEAAVGTSRVVVVNTMQDFSTPQKSQNGPIKSTIVTAIFHCERPGTKELQYESFTGNMGSGESVSLTKKSPDNVKWSGLQNGDDVIVDDIRRVCPPIGPKSPQGPLQILFVCTENSPGVARFKVTEILTTLARDGSQTASAAMQAYGNCSGKSGAVKNPEYLKKAKIIATKGDLIYYIIDTSSEMSFGVVGRN
jgi:hypothetical protein